MPISYGSLVVVIKPEAKENTHDTTIILYSTKILPKQNSHTSHTNSIKSGFFRTLKKQFLLLLASDILASIMLLLLIIKS
jgi:hypothetical protein